MTLREDCAILFLCIDEAFIDLQEKYETIVPSHNESIKTSLYPNAGFDVFFPVDATFPQLNTQFIKMGIRCEMHIYHKTLQKWIPTSYYSFPRSSISKTPLMLANSTGIIDSGYRGQLIGTFRNLSSCSVPYVIEKHTRLLQICAPSFTTNFSTNS